MSIDSVLSRVSTIESLMSSLGASRGGGLLGSTAIGAQGSAATSGSGSSTASSTTSSQFAQALEAARLTSGATPVQDAASPNATGAAAQGLVTSAEKYLGVPYVWGGETTAGMDCSGLVQRALADLGVDAPRTAREQMTMGTPVASLDEALPGDLVVFDGGSHIGIYVGDNRMIHAPKPGKVVQEAEVYEKPTAIRRVLPEAASQSATTTALMSALTSVGATNGVPGTGAAATTGALTSASTSVDAQRLALQMLTGSAA